MIHSRTDSRVNGRGLALPTYPVLPRAEIRGRQSARHAHGAADVQVEPRGAAGREQRRDDAEDAARGDDGVRGAEAASAVAAAAGRCV
eukprot:2147202-Prymnesium_polylepis.1